MLIPAIKYTGNSFTSYSLTAEEDIEGATLNTLQKQRVHNLLSQTAEQKINHTYDVHSLESVQYEAYLHGKLDAFSGLLLDSELALEAKMKITIQSAGTQ